MPELINYKNFFNKSESERASVQKIQNNFIWEEDRKVAKYLGTSEIYLIAIIRDVLRLYDYAQHKKARNQILSEEENNLLGNSNSTSMQIADMVDNLPQKNSTKIKLESTLMEGLTLRPIELFKADKRNIVDKQMDVIEWKSSKTEIEAVPMELSLTTPNVKVINTINNVEIELQDNPRKRNSTEQEIIPHHPTNKSEVIKDTLVQKECGILDYGLEDYIQENSQTDIRNPTQLSYKKSKHIEDIYNSAWAPKSTISSQKPPSPSTYLFTIWDLPKEMKSSVIKSYLSFFGTSTILAWQQNFRTKAAYVKILPSTEQREKSLKEGWSIHLEHGKTYRTTPGKFDITEVEGRNNYKGIIFNIPTMAYDSLLLRQLKKYKVQAVHILNNRNGNQRKRAHLYFKSEEDLSLAQNCNLYYFNTKLRWNPVTENLNGKNTNNSVFYYKRGNSIMSKKNNNNKRPLIETERVKEENRAKRTLTEKSSRTRNGTAIITEDREDSLINNVLRAQSNTRRPLRSTQNKFATGSNRIDLGKKKGKQNEQEIKLIQDENLFKNDSILEQILNRLQKIEEKQGAPTPNYS